MLASSHDQLSRLTRLEMLRTLRDWFTALGIVVLALALMAVRNTVGNPETWASAFDALAASGAFVQYAGWFAAIGLLFLTIAFVLTLYLGRTEK